MTYARRRDRNHREVIAAFERAGCSVIDVAGLPCGFDILVGLGGLTMPVEIKDPAKPPSARRLTDNERRIHDRWTGGARLVTDLQSVRETVSTLEAWHRSIAQSAVDERNGVALHSRKELRPSQ